jgi:hypothetical protein
LTTTFQNFVLRDASGAEYGTVAVDVYENSDGWTGMLYFTKDTPLSTQVKYTIEHPTFGKFRIKLVESTRTTSRKAEFVGYDTPPKEGK